MAKSTQKFKIESKLGSNLRPTSKLKYIAIVNAAREQFLENGFAATNMDIIAEEANVSKRTVYKHFHDKQALFEAVVQLLCEKMVPPSLDDYHPETAPLQEVLTQLGIHFLKGLYKKEQVELYRMVVSDAHRFPELGDMMFGVVTKTEKLIGNFLKEQQKQKKIELKCPEMAAGQFLGLLKTNVQMKLLFVQKKSVSAAEVEKIAKCCVDLFLNGCVRKS